MGDVTKEGEWDAFLQPPEGALPTSGVGDEGGMGLGVCLLSAAAAAKWLQSCLTLCDPTDGSPPTRLRRPWDSPGKSTGVSTRLSFDWVLLPSLPLLPGHLPFRVLCARLTHCLPVATVLLCPHLQTAQSPPRSTAPSPASPDFSTGQNGGIKTKSLFHAPNSQ